MLTFAKEEEEQGLEQALERFAQPPISTMKGEHSSCFYGILILDNSERMYTDKDSKATKSLVATGR